MPARAICGPADPLRPTQASAVGSGGVTISGRAAGGALPVP